MSDACVRTLSAGVPCGRPARPLLGVSLCDECHFTLRFRFQATYADILRDFVDAQESPVWDDGATYCVLLPNGRFKIGYVGKIDRLADRWRSLSRHAGDRVVPLCTEYGGKHLEAYRHIQFAASRVPARGEQFDPTPELRAYVTRGHIPEGLTALANFNNWRPKEGTLRGPEE